MPSPPPALDLKGLAGGPGPGGLLCRISDIEDGRAIIFTFGAGAERYDIFVQRLGAKAFAYVNSCPHARRPLDWRPGHFMDLEGKQIQCASHGARFRIDDGFCVAGPCAGKYLRAVAILIDGDGIFVPK